MTAQMEPDTCIAYLIRHGATDNNLATPPILQGRSVDGPLSRQGLEQAVQAGRCLAALPIRAVYSSPLLRARQTAEAIAQFHDLAVTTIDAITEVDVGAWEQRTWVEIEATDGEAYERFQTNPAEFGYRDGENLSDVGHRVWPAIVSTMGRHRGHQIVIVAHNVVNRVLLAKAIDLPLSKARGLAQDNCGINTLRLRGDRLKAVSINSNLHLA